MITLSGIIYHISSTILPGTAMAPSRTFSTRDTRSVVFTFSFFGFSLTVRIANRSFLLRVYSVKFVPSPSIHHPLFFVTLTFLTLVPPFPSTSLPVYLAPFLSVFGYGPPKTVFDRKCGVRGLSLKVGRLGEGEVGDGGGWRG